MTDQHPCVLLKPSGRLTSLTSRLAGHLFLHVFLSSATHRTHYFSTHYVRNSSAGTERAVQTTQQGLLTRPAFSGGHGTRAGVNAAVQGRTVSAHGQTCAPLAAMGSGDGVSLSFLLTHGPRTTPPHTPAITVPSREAPAQYTGDGQSQDASHCRKHPSHGHRSGRGSLPAVSQTRGAAPITLGSLLSGGLPSTLLRCRPDRHPAI